MLTGAFAGPLARLQPMRGFGLAAWTLAAAWTAWACLVPVGVHTRSIAAAVAPEAAPIALALPVAGRLERVDLVVGRHVDAGAELAALVPGPAEDERGAAEAEVAGLERERAALASRDVAGVGAASLAAAREAVREAEALARAARADEERATAEARRLAGLDGLAAVAPAEREDADAEARRARAIREAAEGSLARLRAEVAARVSGASNDAAELAVGAARLDRDLAVAIARRDAADRAVDERRLRAPVAGTIGETTGRGAGAVAAAGEVLATLIPDGDLRVVAQFPVGVVGRMAVAQPARLRADAYDWVRWGSVPLAVESVASAPRDGTIRVELALAGTTRVPVTAGLVGTVDVELERATPLVLLLRAAGAWSAS